MSYDPERAARFFDEFGESEWARFESGRSSPVSLAVHAHYLRRFVRAGDRVLDVGAGPGRFTIELARLGARVVAADISRVQLELNREKVAEAGLDDRVEARVLADVTDLSRFGDGEFDATVCYGGPLSYARDRAADAAAELVRVTRPDGHVLVSVMSLVGAFVEELRAVLELPVETNEAIAATGDLSTDAGAHVGMRLFRADEARALLEAQGCTVVAMSASNLNTAAERERWPSLDAERREALVGWELDLCSDPAAVACGPHLILVAHRA
jgi:SAM-dependent methyltransferase